MRHSDNRVLAVWGSPSCGKTTIAAKVANYIANKGFDVALLLCDTDAPPLPLLVPHHHQLLVQGFDCVAASLPLLACRIVCLQSLPLSFHANTFFSSLLLL